MRTIHENCTVCGKIIPDGVQCYKDGDEYNEYRTCIVCVEDPNDNLDAHDLFPPSAFVGGRNYE